MEQETHKNYIFATDVPFNEKKKDYLGKFLDYCFKVLDLTEEKPVEISFPTERSEDPEMITTAYYNDGESKIAIYSENRAFIDIARSLAHELVHKKQFSLDPELKTAGHNEKKWEDQANAVAGKIIRGFGKKYPEAYDEGELEESIKALEQLTGKEIVLEPTMAEGNHYKVMLTNIKSMTEDIDDLIGEDDELPSWVQDKITIAEHNMDAILGYLIQKNPDAFKDDEELSEEEYDEACKHLKEFNKFNTEAGNCEVYEIDEAHYSSLEEAEYQGKKVKLGKITRGDVKKFKVYVKNQNDNVVKVNFGDPNMKIKKHIPARRKSFRARHNCDNPGPRWKARYWACKTW